jgi:transcription elongation factor Elf1
MRRRRPLPPRAVSTRRDATTGLETCPVCRRDFVNPVEWDAVEEHGWWMFLRCGECGHSREVTVPNAVAERFDAELNERAATIDRAARRLDSERMAAQVETFIGALRYGLIDPADFAV